MKKFSILFEQLDQTQSTNEKVLHMKNFFSSCTDADGAWALFFLAGHRIKRLISSRKLLDWSRDLIHLPLWLIEECYAAVGDTAETITLLLSEQEQAEDNDLPLSEWMETLIKPLQALSTAEKKERILLFWKKLNRSEIFIFNKILTGSFRLGVSALLTLKALSQALDIPREVLSQRLMGTWEPTPEFFQSLKLIDFSNSHLNPYPFYLAYSLESDLQDLGAVADWIIEPKWDGIRAQAVVRKEGIALWSRGNELISDQFPELIEAFRAENTVLVLDGEIVAYRDQRPLPFGELQKRLGRKNVSKSMIEQVPISFIAYDLLEYQTEDLRDKPLWERRMLLKNLHFSSPRIILSTPIECTDWKEVALLREQSRAQATEGLMLKKRDSIYGVGRQKGYWWKYKVDPLTLDAVLIYAQAGTGRRANLFTDYTFGVWKDNELIPIAKAYSGLNQAEITELDKWIRKNTEEKFGPVRKVKPFYVFEIGFEGIQKSKRHKSEVALRFPRILRWRKDKPINECDTLEYIKKTFLDE